MLISKSEIDKNSTTALYRETTKHKNNFDLKNHKKWKITKARHAYKSYANI